MAPLDITLKRPLLIGGLGLSASLWLLDLVHHAPQGMWMTGAIAVGAGVWWLRSRTAEPVVAIPKQVEADQSAIDQALAKADGLLEQLQAELADADTSSLTCLRQQRQQIVDGLERRALTAAIVGGRATGKTKLLAALETSRDLRNGIWNKIPELAWKHL